jgi:hypothetical protein
LPIRAILYAKKSAAERRAEQEEELLTAAQRAELLALPTESVGSTWLNSNKGTKAANKLKRGSEKSLPLRGPPYNRQFEERGQIRCVILLYFALSSNADFRCIRDYQTGPQRL